MMLFRQGRLLILIAQELGQKYTKALALGFICGLILSLGFWRILPFLQERWFTPVKRIAVVGEFTPGTIPVSIQKEISLGLTQINDDGTVAPSLATSWTATDSGKLFLFTLRSDAVWHNGKKVTSSDVNYNIRNVEFTPLDKTTIRVRLNAPYSPFPAVVAKPIFLPGLIGWGPYKVSALHLNGNIVTSIRLTPTKHTGTPSKEYSFYKTETAAILAYKLGEVDAIEDLSSPADLTTWTNTRIDRTTNYNRIVSLYFHLTEPMLTDRSVRQALAYATPVRSDVVRADSPIPRVSWAYSDKNKEYPLDVKQANKLLGAKNEASDSAHVTITTFATYLSDATDIAQSWTSIGIPTDVKVVSSVPSDYQVLLSAQDVSPDPDQYPFWHSTQSQTNITGYTNVKIDKLLEDGRQELDLTKRKAIYSDFQRYLTEDAPAVFLYYANEYNVTRR